MTATASVSGLASGIDTSSLISQLMAIERQPITLLENKVTSLNSEKTAYQSINTALLALKTTAGKLLDDDTFAAITASSSNASVLTADATTSAKSGVFAFTVNQLASYGSDISANGAADTDTTDLGSHTLTINVGGTDHTLNVSGTLQDMVDSINNAGIGATAYILNDGSSSNPYRLVVQSDTSGSSNDVSVTSATLLGGFGDFVTGQNATLTIGTQTIASPSNTFTDIMPGLSLTANATGSANITVASDTSSIVDIVQEFVDNYNKVITQIKTATSFDSDTYEAGVLLGDTSVSSIESSLATIVTGSVDSNTMAYRLLSQIGVTLGDDGTLSLDTSELESALADDPDAVKSLFSATNGIATLLDNQLKYLTDSTDGLITYRTNALDSNIEYTNERIDELEERLADKEELLTAQFTAMEKVIASLQTSSSYLTQAFSKSSS